MRTAFVIVIAAVLVERSLTAARTARAFRHGGAFATYLALSGVLVLVALSAIVEPGWWQHAYTAVIGKYAGR